VNESQKLILCSDVRSWLWPWPWSGLKVNKYSLGLVTHSIGLGLMTSGLGLGHINLCIGLVGKGLVIIWQDSR